MTYSPTSDPERPNSIVCFLSSSKEDIVSKIVTKINWKLPILWEKDPDNPKHTMIPTPPKKDEDNPKHTLKHRYPKRVTKTTQDMQWNTHTPKEGPRQPKHFYSEASTLHKPTKTIQMAIIGLEKSVHFNSEAKIRKLFTQCIKRSNKQYTKNINFQESMSVRNSLPGSRQWVCAHNVTCKGMEQQVKQLIRPVQRQKKSCWGCHMWGKTGGHHLLPSK